MLFIDALVVKVRDGQVVNRPIYVVIGVTVNGERDILGLWAGDGGEGAKFWLGGADRDQEPRRRGRLHRGLRRAEEDCLSRSTRCGIARSSSVRDSPDAQHLPLRLP